MPPHLVPHCNLSGQPLRILVVDDEPLVCAVLVRALRDYDVTTVLSARGALDALKGTEFDVILTDMMMPEFSGMDLYDAIVATRPDHAGRVLFMTGSAFSASIQTFLQRVTVPILEKPFEIESLVEAIHRLRRQPHAAARSGHSSTPLALNQAATSPR